MPPSDVLIAPPCELSPKSNSDAKRIMVVSSFTVIRDLLENFLQINHHFVFTASDGTEALDRVRIQPVDLIVIDSDMADSGMVRARFKADGATSHLPVLWLGTRCSKENFDPPATADTDGVLPMPFTFSQISKAVGGLLGTA
jgi:two-component system chemotaxis response regulator CheY